MGKREDDRRHLRAANLQRYAHRYAEACLALNQVHSEGKRQRSQFLIRRSLVQRPAAGEADQDPRPAPAPALITQKGWALHFYLIALFEAQTRSTPGTEVRNTRTLDRTGERCGWIDLVPATTATADVRAGMRRQTIRALTQLARHNLVEIKGRIGSPDRYEGFRLRNEAGTPSTVWRSGYWVPGRYTIPALDDRKRIDPSRSPAAKDGQAEALLLPASFFLQGWVHALSAAEIVTYLMIRDLETRYPASSKRGIFVTEPNRTAWYGIGRDVYESHRQLAAYGLIERLDDPNRREDGTILRRPGSGVFLQPHRFRTLAQGLDKPAAKTVAAALRATC